MGSARKKAVTSHDVARRARVSRATVSFVLNDVVNEKISEVTRARVLKATRELGYVPNAAGKALARRKTENIALVYTRSYHHIASHSILLRLIDGLMEVVHERNLRLMIDAVDESDQRHQRAEAGARQPHRRADHAGAARPTTQQLLALARDRFPVVLVGQRCRAATCAPSTSTTGKPPA